MKSQGKLLVLFAALLFVSSGLFAKEGPGSKKAQRLNKVAGSPAETIVNINNFTTWLDDDALFPPVVAGSWTGEFPRGSGVGVIFQEGIVFGGFVNDGGTPLLRVGGTTYPTGMQAGKILQNAQGVTTGAEDPSAPDVRIWRVRPDVYPSQPSKSIPDLTTDAATYFQIPNSQVTDGQRSQILQQYYTDWQQWPAAKGAPWYIDTVGIVRNDAAYDPNNPHDIPGIPGANQSVWFVANDLNSGLTSQLYGSPPIGIEEQMTLWAYATSTPLNNIIFKQVKLIYKGTPTSNPNSEIDSMYVVQWRDPDNGDYGDDFAGCDSTLNLGFVYNGEPVDAKYAAIGLPPPASGACFLQGPAHYTGNPSDSAIINFQWRQGYAYWHPQALTGYDYFAAGSPISDPDLGSANGAYQYFNLMRGDLPRPQYPAGIPFYTASAYALAHGIVTNYMLSGDPVTHTGWVDGYDIGAGDRRDVSVSGPITLKLHDTVEVVVAMVGGLGTNYISSVSVLKYNTTFAHYAYNNLFHLPSPPPSPQVTVTNLSNAVVLDWGNNEASVNQIESTTGEGFSFEGYNIYQLPSPSSSIADGVRIATFDLKDGILTVLDNAIDPGTGVVITKPVEFGTDSGIQRYIKLTEDKLRSQPLVNGQTYYYAVTAYTVNITPGAPFHALESAPVVLTAVPHDPNPGVRYAVSFGDTLKTTRTAGKSDGVVYPIVVDPTSLTGHNYKVTFDTSAGTLKWTLTDVTANVVKLTNQSSLALDGLNPIVDGLEVMVSGPPVPGAKDWAWVAGTRKLTWAQGNGFALEDFNGAFGWASPYGIFNSGNVHSDVVTPDKLANIAIYFANTDVNGVFAASDTNASYGYRYLRNANKPPAQPSFAPFIIHTAATYDWQDYTESVPLAVYNIEDPAHPVRLAVGYMENNVTLGLVDGHYWPPNYQTLASEAVDNASDPTSPREWLFIFDTPYTGATPDPSLEQNILFNDLPVMYMATWCRRGNVPFSSGDEMVIHANHIITTNDVFTFNAPAPTTSQALASADVQKVNVFPNPYYGFQYRETNALNKFVTFSHLPAQATIRIFNLAGVLVRTINKNDPSQFASWDMRNENSLPVASGIYIVYVDMGSLGTKILKLALVQQEQVLPTY